MERCLEAFAAIGYEDAKDMVSCYHPNAFFGALERGEISVDEFCCEIRKASGLELTNDEIAKAYGALLVGIPVEKLRMIKSLRDRGFKIYALSNISEILIEPVLRFMEADSLKVDDYFDHMFLSYQMGVMKPDPKIYEMLISQSGVDPAQTLFIDDAEKNIVAAREFGLQVYLAEAREDLNHLFG
ncbi:MAG: HAD family phosphatase [Rikenellaceae bacterium]